MFLSDLTVVDITVEDPNDSFQDLRDKHDVAYLLARDALLKVSSTTIEKRHVAEISRQFKLCSVTKLNKAPMYTNYRNDPVTQAGKVQPQVFPAVQALCQAEIVQAEQGNIDADGSWGQNCFVAAHI
jgi:hypothetical protein